MTPQPDDGPVRLALYQPDIAQNAGTIMRLAACLGLAVDMIEPAGFPVSHSAFRRAGLDYLEHVMICRHNDFAAFNDWRQLHTRRLVLLTTKAAEPYAGFAFQRGDILMVGRETSGVPQDVHEAVDARLLIPMRPAMRSINVAVSLAMVAGEALRQLDAFPG